ncbi:hypothetical protein GCM10009776_27080 [Microbacterium deminutum]|uniref:Uncharacterized protein n=1 Tax=Microbacterium deminutum TaxID=344164 RepID=A0ABN2R3G6_9MICO
MVPVRSFTCLRRIESNWSAALALSVNETLGATTLRTTAAVIRMRMTRRAVRVRLVKDVETDIDASVLAMACVDERGRG